MPVDREEVVTDFKPDMRESVEVLPRRMAVNKVDPVGIMDVKGTATYTFSVPDRKVKRNVF